MIEVDVEVFEYLQSKARAFVDRPNDVLRRLLLDRMPDHGSRQKFPPNPLASDPLLSKNQEGGRKMHLTGNVTAFVGTLLKQEFGPKQFRKKDNYRLMFETEDDLVYVQNFNKPADHLWYRINDKPWRELQLSRKNAWVCFTYPPGQIAYVIPVNAIVDRVRASRWVRKNLEVNIDPVKSRWVELDWIIEIYKKKVA